MYAELLARSCFSFLQGGSHPSEIMKEAARLELSTVAQADLNGLYGAVRGDEAARVHGVRFIVAAELRLANAPNVTGGPAPPPLMDQTLSIVLLVEDARGYENLCRLLTLSHHN